ncbi:hypothetical protein ACWERI_07565 [Streptomyces collinus]
MPYDPVSLPQADGLEPSADPATVTGTRRYATGDGLTGRGRRVRTL